MTTHISHNLGFTIIAGGAAGDHTLTGITTKDKLLGVLHVDFTDASETGDDLLSEFSITADDTINNAAGTDTSGGFLIILYESADSRGGDLNRS